MINVISTHNFRASQLYFQLFLILVAPFCIAYAIYSRTLDDFIFYVGRVACFVVLLLFFWVVTQRMSSTLKGGRAPRAIPIKTFVKFFGAIALISIPVGVLYYSLGVVLIDAWSNLKNWKALIEQRPIALAVGTFAVLTMGLLFFWFRLRARFIYGASEALAGIAFATHRLAREPDITLPSDDSFYFAVLTAGVYLIVRGLDNMHQGLKDKSDFLAKALVRLGTLSELAPAPPRRLKPNRNAKKRRDSQRTRAPSSSIWSK